jgi:hypothetical protein
LEHRALRCLARFDRNEESIAAAWQRLYEAGVFRRIPERFPDLVDSLAETLVKIHEDAVGPDAVAQLFSCDHLTLFLQQHRENLERLLLQLDLQPLPPQFPGTQIDFEYSEPNYVASVFAWHRRL